MSKDRREAADRIHSASIHLLRRVNRVDSASMGISSARASALSVLVFGGPRLLGGLAEAERCKAPRMSSLFAAMEAEWVVREYHEFDRLLADGDCWLFGQELGVEFVHSFVVDRVDYFSAYSRFSGVPAAIRLCATARRIVTNDRRPVRRDPRNAPGI